MLAATLHRNAVRSRLRNPANAVPDLGIDLKHEKQTTVIPIIEISAPCMVPVFDVRPANADMQELESWELAIKAMRARAKEMRKSLGIDEPSTNVTMDEILQLVSRKYKVSKLDIVSSRRNTVLIKPRHIGFYLSKILTPRSLPEIGRKFGDRDHTTILHGVRKITALRERDPELDAEIEDLIRILTA